MPRLALLSILVIGWALVATAAEPVPPVVREMSAEVTKKNNDSAGRPLPVVSHWANGFDRPSFSSDYQISLLEKGHHVMPTLPFPGVAQEGYPANGKPWVEKLARWKAPFTLRAGQWEAVLYDKNHPLDEPGKWRFLPPEKSPLEVDHDGKVIKLLSPFGAAGPWYEAGVYATRSTAMAQLQAWYADPPLVILLSNNEAGKLKPKADVEATSKRYVDLHGRGKPPEYIRAQLATGYVERYKELLRGVRDGLTSEHWRRRSLLVGYGAFGPPHFGRWEEWDTYSLATAERIDPWHLVWEGGSPSYYTHNWDASSDYRVWSPQVEAQNWVFMLGESYRERPDFWFEISVWDGNFAPNPNAKKPAAKSKRDTYLEAGQTWSPERYAGFAQYGLWLLRPRVLREFRGSTVPRAEFGRDFEALVAGVDRVWTEPVLARFWRDSRLVPNRSRQHPYQTKIPEKWRTVDRWFMLDTSVDPPGPWKPDTPLPVFSLARVRGEDGDREWLIYAHAPRGVQKGVTLELPDFGGVKMDIVPGGSFCLIKEKDRSVKPL